MATPVGYDQNGSPIYYDPATARYSTSPASQGPALGKEDAQQSNTNVANAFLMGDQTYRQLLASGDPSAGAYAQQLLAAKGLSVGGDATGGETIGKNGFVTDPNTGFDWKQALETVGPAIALGGLQDMFTFGGVPGGTVTMDLPITSMAGAGGVDAAAAGGTAAATGGASAVGGGTAAAGGGSVLSKLLPQALQTAGGFLSGAQQQGNIAAQLKNQQLTGAIGATQTNPFTQLQDSQRQQLAQLLVNNYSPQTYTPGHASTGAGDPTTSGTFSGGVGGALQQLPSIASSFGQPAMNAAAQNFSNVASNNPFYQNQLQGVPGFNFSSNATAGNTSGAGANPTQGTAGAPARTVMPNTSIPGVSQGPTTPLSLQNLSKNLAGQSNPFGGGF